MKEKIKLLDFLILIIVLQLMLQGFHAQIIFYIFFSVGLYLIFFFIKAIFDKEITLKDIIIFVLPVLFLLPLLKFNDQKIYLAIFPGLFLASECVIYFFIKTKILKSALTFIFASVIALLIQADNITQIYEYTPYSTRGTASIVEKNANNEDNSSSGYYEYHTMWSFSPGEVLTFIVPSYYGFGNSIYQGPLTQGQEYNANTYIGQIESVDVAMYMGVLIFILGLFAILTMWKDPFVKFLTLLSVLALLISFGKNFSLVFDLLFYHLPYFNKFRVPIMILVLVQMSFPILAGFGLMKIISLRTLKDNRTIKIIKNASIVFSVIFVLTLVLKGPFADWFTGRVNDYVALNPKRTDLTALSSYASDMFTGDLIAAFAILSAAFWAAFAYINSKIGKDILVASIIILTVFDLFRIDSRGEKYINNPDITNMFNPPDYVTAIKNQNDKNPFRMINIKQDGSLGTYNVNSNANFNAYFMLEDFAGYSGIKPRAYQDLIDVIGPVNPTLWRMLNVKYIVADQQIPYPGFVPVMQKEKEIVYRNDQALPRAYFVNKVVSEPDLQLLDDIKANKFDPKNIAFVESSAPKVDTPDSTASVSCTEYKDETIKLNVNATGSNFLFLGDTYLPTGWKASIDGNKTEIYRVNHGFMGIIVPKGKHTVVFNYNPRSFVLSKYLVLSLSSLTLLGLMLGLFIEFKKKRTGKPAGEISGDKK
jgi:hypothetical protein